jgi:hypothetical protein
MQWLDTSIELHCERLSTYTPIDANVSLVHAKLLVERRSAWSGTPALCKQAETASQRAQQSQESLRFALFRIVVLIEANGFPASGCGQQQQQHSQSSSSTACHSRRTLEQLTQDTNRLPMLGSNTISSSKTCSGNSSSSSSCPSMLPSLWMATPAGLNPEGCLLGWGMREA